MRHTVRVENRPGAPPSGPELDPVGAWGLVISLVLGGVAAVLSLVGGGLTALARQPARDPLPKQ